MDKIELIDRAELIADLRAQFAAVYKDTMLQPIWINDPFVEILSKSEARHMQLFLDGLEAYLKTRPTIDAAPVLRSEWVTDDDNTDDWAEPYCKKCGCFIPHGPAHFCPNCGASMRGT